MSDQDRGQITASAAEVYEEFFVPALFREWPPRLLDAARVAAGQRVLDVACGTGVLARAARERVGERGSVVGLDLNPGMLAVARRVEPRVEWREGRAEDLPFPDASLDAVVSQFGLMFFEDRPRALGEMQRVLKPGGRLAVAVWDSIERSPGYAAMNELLLAELGPAAAATLLAPFSLGDQATLRPILAQAGLASATVATHQGTARFPSLESWLHTDVRGWTLADQIDDPTFARLLRAAEKHLARFRHADGTIAFPTPAHVIAATKP